MPEGVEVKIVKEGLEKSLVGDTIMQVIFDDRGEKIARPLSEEELGEAVVGKEITSFNRIGKYIIFNFDDGTIMTSHLAMTGRWLIDVPATHGLTHTRVMFVMKSGKIVRYSDVRLFGRIRIEDDLEKDYYNKGIDVLDATEDEIYEKLLVVRKRRGENAIKKLLLNQRLFCGLGNVYSIEVLFDMKINPFKKINQLSDETLKLMAFTIKSITQAGYEAGGLSLKDYVHVDGSKGSAQDLLQIYQKKECPVCGGEVSKVTRIDKRPTHYCKTCQNIENK